MRILILIFLILSACIPKEEMKDKEDSDKYRPVVDEYCGDKIATVLGMAFLQDPKTKEWNLLEDGIYPVSEECSYRVLNGEAEVITYE